MLTITRIFSFGAAHHLPNYKGKCKNLHGHEWKLEVEISRHDGLIKEGPNTGMIMDFKQLDGKINKLLNLYFDHHLLNDIIQNPTAENIILHLKDNIEMVILPKKTCLIRLRLYETENSFVEWRKS